VITSDTPETDHLEDQLGSAAKFSHPIIWRHARQLERQRDEARRQAADAITNYTLMEAKCFRLEHHDQFKS